MSSSRLLIKVTGGAAALSTLLSMAPAMGAAQRAQCLTPQELDSAVEQAVATDSSVVAAHQALDKLAAATAKALKAEAIALAAYQKAVKSKSKSDDGPAKKKYQQAVAARKAAQAAEAAAKLRLDAVTAQVRDQVRQALEAAQQCATSELALTGTAGNDRVDLAWNAVANVTQYSIVRDGAVIGTTADLSFTDPTAQNGTTYTYEVQAGGATNGDDDGDDDGEDEDEDDRWHTADPGSLSAPALPADDDGDDDDDEDEGDDDHTSGASIVSNPVTLTPVIDIPTGLTASLSAGVVTLSWAAVPNATGYQVWRDGVLAGEPAGNSFTENWSASATYLVRAVDGTSVSGDSTSASVTAEFGAPTALHAAPGDRVVNLTWNPVSSATSYEVWRDGTRLASPTATSYSDIAVTNGTTYSYYVIAVKGLEKSPASTSVSATPAAAVVQPDAPTGLAATAGDAQVSLQWHAVATADSYQVLRGGKVVATVTATNHLDTGLTNGLTYSYTVRAVAGAVTSVDSTTVKATPVAAVVVLAAPTNVKVGTATSLNTGKLRVTWTAVSGATSYEVYRDGALLGTSATATFTPTSTPTGTALYTVRALNANPAATSPLSKAVTGGYWQGSSVADQLGRTVYGYIQVSLTLTDGAITGCWATYPTTSDSGQINAAAIPTLCSQVLAKQPKSSTVSTDITAISGASATVPAFRTSLQNVLTQAGR